jgi:hypothetical protein
LAKFGDSGYNYDKQVRDPELQAVGMVILPFRELVKTGRMMLREKKGEE